MQIALASKTCKAVVGSSSFRSCLLDSARLSLCTVLLSPVQKTQIWSQVMVMDEMAMPLTRIWCIYEVLRTGVPWLGDTDGDRGSKFGV